MEELDIDEFSQETKDDAGASEQEASGKQEGLIRISEGNRRLEEAAGRTLVTMGDINKGGDTKRIGDEVFSPVFGEDFESQSLRQNDRNSLSNQDDLNTSWEKAVSDIEARKRQLQQQREMKQREQEQPLDREGTRKNMDLDQFATPI